MNMHIYIHTDMKISIDDNCIQIIYTYILLVKNISHVACTFVCALCVCVFVTFLSVQTFSRITLFCQNLCY